MTDGSDTHDAVPGLEVTPSIPGDGGDAITKSDAVAVQALRDFQRACANFGVIGAMNGPLDRAGDHFALSMNPRRVIDDPDAFIVDRPKPRQHLSYGAGIHRCVGDRLADLQLRILWEEILARDLDITVMGPPRRLYSNFIRGIRELPVRINAA